MHGPAHWAWGYCPVRWLNRHALVTLPERVEESNAKPVSEQLLSILNSDVLVLILDMTGTAACDQAGGEALNRVYQRAMASGTELRPVVTDEGVRRVLTMTGVGRLVRVYANVAGAMAAPSRATTSRWTPTAHRVGPGRRARWSRTWGPRWRCSTGTA